MSSIRLIYTALLVSLFFSGSMIMLKEGMRHYQNYIVIAIIFIMIMFLLIVKKKIFLNFKNKATLFMVLYLFSATISAIINNNYRMFLHSAQLFFLYLIVGLLISSFFEERYLKIIIVSVLISQVPLIIVSFFTQSIITRPYSGVFYNANSFGTVIASIFPILLVFIDEQIIKRHKNGLATVKNYKSFILYLLFGIILLYLILISGSRTSLGTVVFLICIHVLLLCKKLGIKSSIVKIIPVTICLLIVLFIMPPINNALLDVFEKNIIRLEHSSGITAGRVDFWGLTIKYASLFGNGHDFFGVIVPNNAHNTFFEILGIYGWVPLITFLLWIITILLKSLQYTNYYNIRFNNLPLLLVITFILLSLGEGMLMKLSMLAMFSSIGPVLRTQNEKITKQL